MEWIIILVLFLILMICTKIYVTVNYSYLKEKKVGSIRIYIFKIPIYRKKINPSEVGNPSLLEKFEEEFDFTELYHDGKKLLFMANDSVWSVLWIMKKIQIHKFQWHTNVGSGEASSGGLLSGGIWSIKGAVIAFLHQTSNVKCQFHVNVIPFFQQKLFQTQINMKVSIRIGPAIIGGLKFIRSISHRKEIQIKLSERKI
ncbi:DUF2953 domain-containing protein [Virgibacillus flavescens]|uniref:DUF2953 domain-containing protein n=1 Tax=Virgibacillus flavescens TaxID=1611422 RepID=UPI003D3327FF